jgi:hypothetical protein
MKPFVRVTPCYYNLDTNAYEKEMNYIVINRDHILKIVPYSIAHVYEIRMVGESSEEWIKVDQEGYLDVLFPDRHHEPIDVGMP